MGDGYNFQKLKSEILPLSHATDWTVARKEWALVGIDFADEPETCLCGHHPIIEICTVRNSITRHSADVGNVCVNRFLGIDSKKVFDAIKRIKKDISKSLNPDAIAFFFERRAINNWEYNFLQETYLKRNLTTEQVRKRKEINTRLLAAIERRGFRGPGQ